MTTRLAVWWHRRRTGHKVVERRVTPPRFDPSARGILWRCLDCPKHCERTWAL